MQAGAKSSKARVAVASVAAPLLLPLIAVSQFREWQTAAAAAALGYFGMALGGPLLALVERCGLRGLRTTAVGFLVGIAAWAAVISALHQLSPSNRGLIFPKDAPSLLWAGAIGLMVAIIFRLIAYARQPGPRFFSRFGAR